MNRPYLVRQKLPRRNALTLSKGFPRNIGIMAMINVNRGAESLGVFSEEDVRAGLRTGRFAPTDLGWREGMTNWQTLAQFPEFAEAIGAAAPSTGATVAPGGAIFAPRPARAPVCRGNTASSSGWSKLSRTRW